MKVTNIFNKTSTVFLAGALAFTFVSCDTDTRNDQAAEQKTEAQPQTGDDITPPDVANEPDQMDGTAQAVYDDDQEYTYEEREVVIERVRNDLQRAEESLERIEERIETEGREVKQEWDSLQQDLQEVRQDLNQQLQELEATTEEDWERVRNETQENLKGWEVDWEAVRTIQGQRDPADTLPNQREKDLIETETGTGSGEETGAGVGTGIKTTGSTTEVEEE